MDERLQRLLESLQKTACTVGDTAADAAQSVGRKTTELLSVGKLNIRLADLRAQTGTALREVGELIYATHAGSPTDSDVLLKKLAELDGIYAEIADTERALGRLRGERVCPACGAAAQRGDGFCRACGEKL